MLLACLAMLVDTLTGEPKLLYSRIKHPVSWMAAMLMFLERRFNKPSRKRSVRKFLGTVSILLLILLWGATAWIAENAIKSYVVEPYSLLFVALIASVFIAARSLFEHINLVKNALDRQSVEDARCAVGMVVGRETADLDELAVSRAAAESLAENFSDGVIAPLFWLLIGGLPGLIVYKMVNTADSMIGHRTERFRDFGWASAKLDDAMNLLPARITALLLALGAFVLRIPSAFQGFKVAFKDAYLHASPNAGWPEATMAGLLKVRLGGPRSYGPGQREEYAWLGADFPETNQPDLGLALCIVKASWLVLFVLLMVGGVW
ncbi:adenosylcobinamide-phosphate synthase CbiB [Kordiimonas laminariae]|uniref:adenosylcobinamide-phosphate synthase CbiB n=1 Tax=Kordiimonas laminariae TaxID=2917717 RepID=UPI001FF233D7|nr:adenosylcobinamide-phosphate synthase CbiB [Kordiimonas laminariae]MCK0071079.1 adenosylcobinamide-phosphate synthase CbiB [Kordiimonas laminariae]